MKKTTQFIILQLFLFSACVEKIEGELEPAPLYTQPQRVELNTSEGYEFNSVTGQKARAILLKTGDTLITGKPIPVNKRVVHLDSVSKPVIVKQSEFDTVIFANDNIKQIPNELTVIPVNKDELIVVTLEEVGPDDKDHFKVNSIGDTIRTGIPIPVQGEKVIINLPKPVKAEAPRHMETAVADLLYLDVDQGMESSYVSTILNDRTGNIWLGCPGGVSRYDGQSFTHFTIRNGLKMGSIYSLMEDSKGNIWIGAFRGGLIRYDGESFTYFNEKHGLDKSAGILLEDSKGNLWLTSGSNGITLYDGETFTHYTTKEGLIDNIVSGADEDKEGNIWISTNNGVCRFDGESFTHFTVKDGLPTNVTRTVLVDKDNNVWFGTLGFGVYRYDGESITRFTQKEGLSSNMIIGCYMDKAGNIWFGTYGGGANKFDGKAFSHFTTREGVSGNHVRDITEDHAGNIWFSTAGNGITRYDPGSFTHFTEKEGLPSPLIMAIFEDSKGKMWFGSQMSGLCIYDGKSFSHLSKESGLSANEISDFLEDRSGNIWVATSSGGVIVYDGNSFTHYNSVHFSGSDNRDKSSVLCIDEDQMGNVWLGTGAGPAMFDGESFTLLTAYEQLNVSYISGVTKDTEGNMWFSSSDAGAARYDGETITFFTEKEGLGSNMLWSIYADKEGNLWFGTHNSGAIMFDGESFTYFTVKEGLSSNTVFSIKEDDYGAIWLGTESGLSKISKDETEGGYIVNSFGKLDGIKGMDFYFNSVCKDSKNRLWWGTGKSLSMLDLNKYNISEVLPDVKLKRVDINEQYIDYRNIPEDLSKHVEFDKVQPFSNYPLNLELPFNKNHLTFYFGAIDWNAQHQLRYSYFIEGLSKTWSIASEEGKADYRNIPYGNYVFKAKAIGEGRVWGDAFEYPFSINPPWWHTWWARTLYGLTGLLIILLVFRWRVASLKQRQKELEHEVDLATTEIRKQKNEIEIEKERSDELLLNILPSEVADELKAKGHTDAQLIDHVTVLFTDFKGFTSIAEKLSPEELVNDLNVCFSKFDEIMQKHNIEKIKTIGDSYMAAGGLPTPNNTHTTDVVKAAFEIRDFIEEGKTHKIEAGRPYFEIRIGVHTGPVIAGIVGVKKFQYDIWGDTVNTASRMESNSQPGKVNISQTTYELLKENKQFHFESRGKIDAKGKGEMEMYFVDPV